MTDGMAVVLTALNLEYKAVRQKLVDVRLCRHNKGTRFEVGCLRGTNCRVALGLTDKGNNSAGVLAERAIQMFTPAAVLFVGVAGALWDIPLGDVVSATRVYAYQGGTSEDDGLKARPRVWDVTHGVSQLAAHLARIGDWTAGLASDCGTPSVHFGAIAAGEIVQNSRMSREAKWIRDHYNDALAIEMEAAGVAQACHLNDLPVAIVRGISDRADGTKTTGGDNAWQPRAAANAAAFAVRLAEELIKERGHIAMHVNGDAAGGGTSNFNTGQVGIQAGYVTNSTVHMGSSQRVASATDLVAELAALRDHLKRERATGKVDDATYEAAAVELDIADKALEENTSAGRSRFVMALKRLRGLIADVAELAVKVATVIAAVKGLP